MDAPRKVSTATNEIRDACIHDVILVTQLPSQSWFEGFALRPNGHILATRLDEPELYMWDAEDADAQPALIHTFDESSGVINLSALPGKHDTFVVLSGVIDMGQVIFEDFILWEVSFGSGAATAAPTVTRLMKIEGVGMVIGVTPLSDCVLLVPDTQKACIWEVDLTTKTKKLLIEDETMSPASQDDPFGINRMRIVDGHIWFTNSSKGILGRIPIQAEPADGDFGGRGVVLRPEAAAASSSHVQQIATNLVHCDGLSVLPDATAAYTASYNDGLLWKVEVDKATGESEVTTVMSNLVNPTAVELIQVGGRLRLFIICNGEIEAAWVTGSDRMSWGDLRGLNETVTVSTSTVVTTTEIDEGTPSPFV